MSVSTVGNTNVMSSFGNSTFKDQKASFWKKNTKNVPGSSRPVYGAQHPPIVELPAGGTGSQQSTPKRQLQRSRDSFQDFQDNTNDAWDDGDDDLISMANFKMSRKDVQSTAMQVINDHSQQQQRAQVGHGNAHRDSIERIDSFESRSQHNTPHGTPTHSPNQNKSSGPGVGIRLQPSTKPTRANTGGLSGHLPPPGREAAKSEKFKQCLKACSIDLEALRALGWSGIPREFRPVTWKLLCGYLPPIEDRRELTLQRKRQEYFNFVDHYYDTRLQDIHADTFRQISIDIPRMSPLIPLFQQKLVQEIFERILFIWAIRHPASGYVQGINDLVTPFFVVFLSEFVSSDVDIDNCDISGLPAEQVRIIEADSFWCFSKLLDSIQDNYTFAQPGIQYKVVGLKDIISRVDHTLHKHLENQHVEYLQFSFRWMNNLLMREIPLRCTIRLWDSYLAEPSDFATLHLYVCAALLLKYSDELKRERDFQGLMLYLQNLPTHNWGNDDISLLLAEAYRLRFTYADAPNHLNPQTKK